MCENRLSLKHVAEAGSLAEEVISTIRTAQAFGSQIKLGKLYNAAVEKAAVLDSTQGPSWFLCFYWLYSQFASTAIFHGLGLGSFFFIIYSSYGLGKRYYSSLWESRPLKRTGIPVPV